jgi:glucose uptake protein/putative ribose uptake protein
MGILIGLIPAVSWGILPLAVSKLGGKPVNQIFGTTMGAVIVALVLQLARGQAAPANVFLFCFISGAFWALGQMLQYTAYTEIGVSKAMPLSTGMQLLGTSLMGVLAFGEWASVRSKLIGFGCIAVVVAGVIVTSYKENKQSGDRCNMKKAVTVLLVSTIGYVGYSGFPRLVSADGWVEFFPQTVGMFAASIIFSLFMAKGKDFNKNLLTKIYCRHNLHVGAWATLYGKRAIALPVTDERCGGNAGRHIAAGRKKDEKRDKSRGIRTFDGRCGRTAHQPCGISACQTY